MECSTTRSGKRLSKQLQLVQNGAALHLPGTCAALYAGLNFKSHDSSVWNFMVYQTEWWRKWRFDGDAALGMQ
jgi:hypothetical protein